jgi:Putative peptidoglycan binding domain
MATRRAGIGYAMAWAMGIGVGAVAAGAFVGFLVNGPPGRTPPIHTAVNDVAPPTPAPKPVVETNTAAATPSSDPGAPTKPDPAAAKASTTDGARGAPSAAPAASPTPPPPTPLTTTADIREMQGRLRSVGFNPGPVDGAAGPQTAAAVKQYQQARGMTPTGVADSDVLARLREESPAPQQTQAPRPPARTYASAPRQQPRDPLMESIEKLFRR